MVYVYDNFVFVSSAFSLAYGNLYRSVCNHGLPYNDVWLCATVLILQKNSRTHSLQFISLPKSNRLYCFFIVSLLFFFVKWIIYFYTIVSALDCDRCRCMMWKWQHAKGMFTHQTQTVHKATSTICMSKHALCLPESANVITRQVTCFSCWLKLEICFKINTSDFY